MTQPTRKVLQVAAAGVATVLLVYAGTHLWIAREVSSGFEAWRKAQAAQGLVITCDPPVTGYRLFAPGIRVTKLSVSGPGWRWSTDSLDVTVPLWSPNHLRLYPDTQERVTAGNTTATIDSGSMTLDVSLSAGTDPMFEATAVVVGTSAGPITIGAATFSQDGTTGRVSLALRDLTLPPGYVYVLGPTIAATSVEARVTPPITSFQGVDVAKWRDDSGTVQIMSARVRWGELLADATGTATLDRALQPVVDGRVVLAGADAALSAAVAQGSIQPRLALAIRAVLSLVSGARPTPGAPPGALPVALADGTVSLAGFPVARVPPIAWSR